MAFDENVAARMRHAPAGTGCVEERRLFGGIGFILGGKMLVGSW